MAQCSIVAIHGIGMGTGAGRSGFSAPLKALVKKSANGRNVSWDEFVWETSNDRLDSLIGTIVRDMVEGPLLPSLFGGDRKSSTWRRITAHVAAKVFRRKIAALACKAIDLGIDFPWYLDSINGSKIRENLRKKIREVHGRTGNNVILLAHSLGSVIAYDCLAEAKNIKVELPVARLLTFGSPLEWTFSLRKLDRRPELQFKSIGAIPWDNFYYKEDYVPLYKPLDTEIFGAKVNNSLLKLPKGIQAYESHYAYWNDDRLAKFVCAMIFADACPT